MRKVFYGWWVVAAAFVTFGLSVGLTYYNMSFFYDYYTKTYGWSQSQVTRGFLYATLCTIWVAPILIPKFSPRKLIIAGTGLMSIAFLCWGNMNGSIWVYWGIWIIYSTGYMLAGPVPHQIIISRWFRLNRGKAMGVLYVGVGLIGFLGSYLVKPLTEHLDFHKALMIMGALVLLAWPVVVFVIREKPSEMGLNPDGAAEPAPEIAVAPRSFRDLTSRYSFWLLVLGSMCSIGSIGAVNFVMKFVFIENMAIARSQPNYQPLLNSTWQAASMIILLSSIGGRLLVGTLSDRFAKKIVMVVSYLLSAATIPILLTVEPPTTPWVFSLLFGFAMGADYMLIPLVAAEQFGLNSLPRCMAIIFPMNTICQTGFPALTAWLSEQMGGYRIPLYIVFGVGVLSAISIALLPRREKDGTEARAAANG